MISTGFICGVSSLGVCHMPAFGCRNPSVRVQQCRYMAVAKPGIEKLSPEDISVFKVPFGAFVKMHAGTWHAGPHFADHEHMDFYNLELADTNQVR